MKEYDLETAAADIAPLLHTDTVLLPVLNGVNIAERIRSISPGCGLSGLVCISSFVEAPGVIREVGGAASLSSAPMTGSPINTGRWRGS